MSIFLFLLALVFFILLIIGLFSPRTSLFWVKGERTRGKSLLINGIALFLSFFLFVATSPPDVNQDNKADSETKESAVQSGESDKSTEAVQVEGKELPKYKKIGDQVDVGHFSYKVNSVKFAKSVGSDYFRQTADGIYLIANVTFRNNDNEEHTLDNSFFKLTDEEQTEFASSTDGENALEMSGQETLFLKQCNPKITKSGLLIFEVPEKKVYDLHLSGGFWSGETAVVKLTTQ